MHSLKDSKMEFEEFAYVFHSVAFPLNEGLRFTDQGLVPSDEAIPLKSYSFFSVCLLTV